MAKKSVAGTVADPAVRFATLKIGEKEYKLAFDFNAIAEAERVCGVNLLAGGLTFNPPPSANQFRGLFYAALSVADPEVTVEAAGRLITFQSLGPITRALMDAYGVSMPEPASNPTKATPAAES